MSLATSAERALDRVDMESRGETWAMQNIALLLICVGVAIRIVRLVMPSPIWGDEAMLALNFLDRDYAGLTRFLDNGQVAPVLFLWAERFVVANLGTQDWEIRLVPFLASIAGLLLFWDFARRTVPAAAATIAVGLMAVSVWPVSMAATAKPYAGDLFWTALLLVLAVRWRQAPERIWPLAALATLVPFALGSSYPVVFVAGGVSLYLLPAIWNAGRIQKTWFAIYNLMLLATFAAIYATVGQAQVDPTQGTTGSYMMWYWRNGFPPESVWEWPVWFLQANTGRMYAYPLGDANFGSTATTLLVLTGIWSCWRHGNRSLLVLCFAPFLLNLLAAFLGKYPYAGCCRLSQHLAPAICLLAGVGWASALELYSPWKMDRLAKVKWVAGLLIVMGTVGLIHRCIKVDHDPIARFSARLYQELAAEIQPGDSIVICDRAGWDPNTLWYIKRFGNAVIELRSGERLPPSDRIWLITMSADESSKCSHQLFVESDKAWRPQETFTYTIRSNSGDEISEWQYMSVTCLVHPGDNRPAPRFNMVP